MQNLIQALIDSGNCETKTEAMLIIAEMHNEVLDGNDPEEILSEYGLEPDYVQDLLDFGSGNVKKSEPAEDSISMKIKALLDKAASSDSLAERESFMLGAQKLLLKYNLTSDRVMASGKRNEREENIIDENIKFEEVWDMNLIYALCKGNMCQHIRSGSYVHIIGKESNVNIVCSMFVSYRSSILKFSIETYNGLLAMIKYLTDSTSNPKKKAEFEKMAQQKENEKKTYFRDYLAGAVQGLKEKMEGKIQEFIIESDNSCDLGDGVGGGSGRGMILANDNRIQEYISRHYPNLTYGRNSTGGANHGSGAFKQGQRDGGSIGHGATGRKMIK